MANKIIPKRSSVSGKVPATTDLDVGEIAVNLTDKKIYTKDAAGAVVQLGGGSGSGDVVGPASSTGNAIARFNGTTGKLLKDSSATMTDAGVATFPGLYVPGLDATANNMKQQAFAVAGISVCALGGYPSNVTANNGSYTFYVDNSVKIFMISQGNGNGVLCIANYLSATITILGDNAGTVANTSSPASNQLGVYKSANSHQISIKMGSAAATQFGQWSIVFLGSTPG